MTHRGTHHLSPEKSSGETQEEWVFCAWEGGRRSGPTGSRSRFVAVGTNRAVVLTGRDCPYPWECGKTIASPEAVPIVMAPTQADLFVNPQDLSLSTEGVAI